MSAERNRQLFSSITAIVVILTATFANAYTQGGGKTDIGYAKSPMGHEWITRLAALEVLGGDPLGTDPNDPRNKPAWGTKGRAKNPDVSKATDEVDRIKGQPTAEGDYKSAYKAVFATIIGQRWVDIGGFNVAESYKLDRVDCWDAVAQEAADVQYDHFMRRYDDSAGIGALHAADESQKRFVKYFIDAAVAPAGVMLVWDGGGATTDYEVDRNYFLFGRALHLFQDSFSPEHTVRLESDNYEQVRQVKSYLCAAGSEQHSHAQPAPGDIIWEKGGAGWGSYKASAMFRNALVATEASRDLWAAFIRTMNTPIDKGREAVARREAQTLVDNWLHFDRAEMAFWYTIPGRAGATFVQAGGEGVGMTQDACMLVQTSSRITQAARVAQLEKAQRTCIYNIKAAPGYADLFDPAMRMPYNWKWIDKARLHSPKAGYEIPDRPADRGTKLRLKGVTNGKCLTAVGGLKGGAALQTRSGEPLELILVSSEQEGEKGRDGYLRARFAPRLFVGYNPKAPQDMKLESGPDDSRYRFDSVASPQVLSLFSHAKGRYFRLNGDTPQLDPKAKAQNADTQWYWTEPTVTLCSN